MVEYLDSSEPDPITTDQNLMHRLKHNANNIEVIAFLSPLTSTSRGLTGGHMMSWLYFDVHAILHSGSTLLR